MNVFSLTHFTEELIKQSHQVSQGEVVVSNHSFYLMKLCQMGSIQRFVTKDAIDREILDRSKFL